MQRSPGKQKYTAETWLKVVIHVAILCVKTSPKTREREKEKPSYNLGAKLASNGNNTVDCKLSS